jgi:hypothetical protein
MKSVLFVVFYSTLVSWASTITCSNSGGKCNVNGSCVDSEFGVRCLECNSRGYTVGTDCKCYSRNLNPSTGCQLTLAAEFMPYTVQGVEITHDRTYCVSYADEKNGFYETIDPDLHQFGRIDPPVPMKCFSSIYGPSPGELVEDEVLPTDEFEECNTFGGPDPNELVPGFRACHGHGDWNKTSRECECHSGWRLSFIGLDYYGDGAYSCTDCDYHFGPSIDPQGEKQPPYCLYVESPDPITGEQKECGGRGLYINGACSCYSNSTVGYWDLGMVGGVFDSNNTERFTESCILCSEGYHTYPFCL